MIIMEHENELATMYLCDRKECGSCNPECYHTRDIAHAVNFEKLSHSGFPVCYWEKKPNMEQHCVISEEGPTIRCVVEAQSIGDSHNGFGDGQLEMTFLVTIPLSTDIVTLFPPRASLSEGMEYVSTAMKKNLTHKLYPTLVHDLLHGGNEKATAKRNEKEQVVLKFPLPDSCVECKFAGHAPNMYNRLTHRICVLKSTRKDGRTMTLGYGELDYTKKRHEECPLKDEK